MIDWSEIRLVCYDFDGVMTDNTAIVLEDGVEGVRVNRADGLAVAALKRKGIAQLIISTEANRAVAARASKLGIPALQGVADKRAALETYAAENGIALNQTAYVGNDVNDLAAMKIVAHPIAPADAHPCVKNIAVLVTRARGGEGVVRELYETVFGPTGL
jgi:YrbI family 3-deoxy-D-manno-octulosonate 8-phosphate phosphatase